MDHLRKFQKETYYRNINIPAGDLRISIVAGCNMRCSYCHNEGQGEFSARRLSLEQVKMIVEKSLKFGVRKVRLTGGEPLTHPDISEICRELKRTLRIPNLGINTNGTLRSKLLALVSDEVLDQIVVGIDRFSGPVSKQSPIGVSSSTILRTIIEARAAGANIQIASVYEADYENTRQLVKWSLDNGIVIKILEISDLQISTTSSAGYISAVNRLIEEFRLDIGVTADLGEFYGVDASGGKVLFFHSHCRLRQCKECSHLHMRVTADGIAKPCLINNKTEFALLTGDFEHNMRRAIHNLGVPPEGIVI